MAKQLYVEVIDDIDGSVLEDEGERITFAVGGTQYEIDLGEKNAAEFHRAMDLYVSHATRVGSRSTAAKSAKPATGRSVRAPEQVRAIREWARTNGYEVSARGRIPAEVERAFDAAH